MERNFIKLFNHAYSIVVHCLIESHVYACDCRLLVRDSIDQLESILQDMQNLPEIINKTRNQWKNVVFQARSRIADFCDDGRNILLRCRNRDHLSSSQTLELHLLSYITTSIALQIIWKDLVEDSVNVHPTKSNIEILEFTKESFITLGSFHPDIVSMMRIYPQHYLTIVLTWHEKPDDLKTMCSKALKFLGKNDGDALVPTDRENIGSIIKTQINKFKYTAGCDITPLHDPCMDIDSENSWSDQYSTESSEDTDYNPFDDSSDHDTYFSNIMN